MRNRIAAMVALVVPMMAFGSMTNVAASPVVVTPSSMGNWAFDNRDGTGAFGLNPTGSGAMVNGPGIPPLGGWECHEGWNLFRA